MRAQLSSTRGAKLSQSPRAITRSKAPTWNHSSTSTERALTKGTKPPPQSKPSGCGLLVALQPLDEHGERMLHARFLLDQARFQPVETTGHAIDARGDRGELSL